jgi:LPS sulfotransferase NodH
MVMEPNWHREKIDRRWTETELSSAAFDSANESCSRRVLLFTSQRSASWTACRFLMAAGWGVPCEYFSIYIVNFFNRFCGGDRTSIHYSDLGHYRRELERRRSRNAVFSTKVGWRDYHRLRAGYLHEEHLIDEAVHIFYYRRDFASQVVSSVIARQNWRYSFTNADLGLPPTPAARGDKDEADRIRMHSEILLKDESSWLLEFTARGWRPILLESESFLAEPLHNISMLASASGLPLDRENILLCQQFETGGRYNTDREQKQALLSRHVDLLASLTERRERQLRDLGLVLPPA